MVSPVIIIGAGASGLGLAWRLASRKIPVVVLESDRAVGGLAATERSDGYSLDFGPHSFFSEDRQVLERVLALFDGGLTPTQRRVKFFYKGKFLDYPLTPSGVLLQMGLLSGIRSALSYFKSQLLRIGRARVPDEEETVEQWAIGHFGEHLYRTFFKPYTEQFWKVSCAELSSRSIPTHTRMSFINTLRLLLRRRRSSGVGSLDEREALPTYYPATGFGEICERVADTVRETGGEIRLGCRVVRIANLADGRLRVVYEIDGREESVEGARVVSTQPLGGLIDALDPPAPENVSEAAGRLDYRALVVLGMVTEKSDILGCGYIYVLNRPYNRISEMNEFSGATSPDGDNILAVEIPCLRDGAAWNATKEELYEMCAGSLAEDGFLSPGDVKRLLLLKASHAYPIYRKDYARHLKTVLGHVEARSGLSALGRCGEFRYMDVDECLGRAFDVADKIIEGL